MTTIIEKEASQIFNESLSEGEKEPPSKLSEVRPSNEVIEQLSDSELNGAPPERIRRKYVRGSRPARVTKVSIERSSPDLSSSKTTFENWCSDKCSNR